MPHAEPDFVPKTDPRSRHAEPEDPMELMAEQVVGDPAIMLECILQEFAWMGWNSEQLLSLFHNPGYPMLCDLRAHYGDDEIRRQVEALVEGWGVFQFRETIAEPDPTEDEEPLSLVQIDLSLPRNGL